ARDPRTAAKGVRCLRHAGSRPPMDEAAQLQGDGVRDRSARRRPLSPDAAGAHRRIGDRQGNVQGITAPERIVFTWKSEGDGQQMGALPETLVTVTFAERKGEQGVETEVQLLHSVRR